MMQYKHLEQNEQFKPESKFNILFTVVQCLSTDEEEEQSNSERDFRSEVHSL